MQAAGRRDQAGKAHENDKRHDPRLEQGQVFAHLRAGGLSDVLDYTCGLNRHSLDNLQTCRGRTSYRPTHR